ncbi:phosphate/phosphite/phosphonate ABC transporter substrate-binding protein [Rhodococcus sp. BP-316]|uniref:phosphate/phosphite/phosphonate ABC transporter substrate-binding protein n=1 Tax=Rhodococcus sp. BP-316 TaxID=2739445 RepID=UPI001C9AC276|nr:phosphate/phosphite/phosphonate ABC transporter substrate-binding protein [Rhodococcus sp. BP-316]MBY6682105.1 phosphate/phosphite/phosphonate ABC transporter substrate-binding protein [Rhodococcus sp. BP-316]
MRVSRSTAAVITVAVTTLALGACGSGGDAVDASPTCPGGTIRFGVEPFEDPAKLTPAFQVVGEALSEKLNCPVEVTVVDNYSAEVLAMRNGQLELGVFGPLGYVFASQEADARPLASFGTADGVLSTYTAGVWVPKDSDIQSIEDLRGRSLALSEPGSTSGDALPRMALRDSGMQDSDVSITYAGGHPEALLALANGKVDAAEINSQQLATSTGEGQFDTSQFRQVWASDPIPNDPITVAGGTSEEFQKAVADALLDLPADAVAEAGALLDVEPAGQLLPVDKSTYQPLFDLATTLGLTSEDAG